MSLDAPLWLLLMIPVATGLWLWRAPTRPLEVLRALTLGLVVFAMARPTLTLPDRTGTVVIVADRSRSMPADAAAREQEAVELVQAAMEPRDRLAVLSFGERVIIEQGAERGASNTFGGFDADPGGDASDLSAALDRAMALIPRDEPGRVLVLSDGRWTGTDPMTQAGRAASQGVAIDYRELRRPAAADVAIERVDAPITVGPGEGFMLTAWIQAPTAMDVAYTLRRGGTVLSRGEQRVGSGRSRLIFRDRAPTIATTLPYTLEVVAKDGEADPMPENNHARLLVGVDGPRPLLVLSPSIDSGLVNLYQRAGLEVANAPSGQADLSLENLSGFGAVVIENVPAERLTVASMENLASWVESGGGGLLMSGGQHAFGPGGYFGSPLERVLPVSMELRQEHRKLSLAIVVALDRSGSMAASAGGGRTKMDLANLGTVQVLDLLSAMDEFGVLAIDSSAHVISPLAPLTNKEEVRSKVLHIDSMGGGIFIYEALSHAAEMLLDAKAQTRHIILFSDAMDSEEPGQYQQLLERCREEGITVSVMGLGTAADVDANLLKDIAARGDGRVFFTQDATELPRLFAQDTFVVARSSFIDEPTPVSFTPRLQSLLGRSLTGAPPAVGGYNLAYLREGANLAAVTQDEYNAPLVAAWQAGSGRALAYTGEADGRFAGPIASWSEAGEMHAGLARWALGEQDPLPDAMLATHVIDRGVMRVRLYIDPEAPESRGFSPPEVAVLRGEPGRSPEAERRRMEWTAPDMLELSIPMRGGETVLPTLEVPSYGPLRLSPGTLPYSPEYAPAERGTGADERGDVLAQLAASTGGVEASDLPSIWNRLPKVPQRVPLTHWLLFGAIAMLLLEVLERRTGVVSGMAGRPRRAVPIERAPKGSTTPRQQKRKIRRPPSSSPPVSSDLTHPPAPSKPAAPTSGITDALRQAQEKARRRSG